MFYTYAHYTPEGRLFYIGKGNGARAYSSKGRNVFWRRVVKKHGKPKVQILANWDTEQDAFSHEVLLIDCFRDMGYRLSNLTGGGEGSIGLTPWNKGKPWSEEVKRKQGLANLNNKHWVGRKHSEQSKKKQSLAKVKYRYVGTNIETKEQIVLFGRKAINDAGFTSTHVYRCAKGLAPFHKGYTWVKEKIKE